MMKTAFVFGTLVALSAATGCASDPNKEVKTAQAEEATEMRKARVDGAEDRKDAKVDNAEARKDREEKRAEVLPTGTQDRVDAQANMRAERDKYVARATARYQKSDARIDAARRKVDIAGAKASPSVRDRIRTADTQKSLVKGEMDQLTSVSDDHWKASTEKLDKHLDDLETLAKEAESKADSAVK